MAETKHTVGVMVVGPLQNHWGHALYVDDTLIAASSADTPPERHDQDEANLEHLARCWNAHDALVEALQETLLAARAEFAAWGHVGTIRTNRWLDANTKGEQILKAAGIE